MFAYRDYQSNEERLAAAYMAIERGESLIVNKPMKYKGLLYQRGDEIKLSGNYDLKLIKNDFVIARVIADGAQARHAAKHSSLARVDESATSSALAAAERSRKFEAQAQAEAVAAARLKLERANKALARARKALDESGEASRPVKRTLADALNKAQASADNARAELRRVEGKADGHKA